MHGSVLGHKSPGGKLLYRFDWQRLFYEPFGGIMLQTHFFLAQMPCNY
jgi:hypothetical protein